MKTLIQALVIISLTALHIHARTWTSSDGAKTFEGELTSYDPATGVVGVKLANGKELKFARKALSEADITFLGEQGKVEAPAAGNSPAGRSSTGKIDADPKNLSKPHDGKPADMTKPVQVFIMMGQSNMLGFGNAGQLKGIAAEKYPYVIDEAGNDKSAPLSQKMFDFVAMPEFKDQAAVFYTKPVATGSSGSHYGGNAETYMNVGEGMGRAMVELLAK